MLQSLHIRNYVLIKELDINFSQGFSVLTGETGAGKSIILGAIGLLLGQRADTKMISEGEKHCIIEAEFNIEGLSLDALFQRLDIDSDDATCIIRRELSSNGKSRAFVNDTPVALPALRELGDKLIDIHSQHKNLLLATENFQLQVLDTLAADSPLREDYERTFTIYTNACHRLAEAQAALEQSQADEDYLRFQLQQLEELNLESGRQDEMEREQQVLEHAEEIKAALWTASCAMQGDGESQGAIALLHSAQRQLESISSMLESSAELTERLESALIEVRDIASSVEAEAEAVSVDPARLEVVSEWLSALYSAMRKHHVDDEEALIALRDELSERLLSIANSDEHINNITRERDEAYDHLLKTAQKLTKAREKAAKTVEAQMLKLLAPLGIPNVQFQVAIQKRKEPAPNGLDQVEFLFSANQGSPLRPISEVASGGEIARVMLSLKTLMSGATNLPTIIFDEIDTGVSGHIAERMAQMMLDMGKNGRQVISITHLPQIAALGQHHYRVFKTDDASGTTSHIEQLSPADRITEIAHMLSGAELTQAAIDNARELLKIEN
ncbi:MAG: DNA repair protein RecN [Bacteroidaceae bacterium]|nr:DNA repair protein RecN [Bacteroidaceae bacterium]